MKNKILVPFDFTKVSINALIYAITSNADSEIIVFHVGSSLIDLDKGSGDGQENTPLKLIENSIKKYLKENLSGHDLSNVKIKVSTGIPASQIVKESRSGYDSIVMGSRDKYNLFDKWIGTQSLGVVKQVDIPTYLIPLNAGYNGYSKIVVASDSHLNSPELVNKIKAWNNNSIAFLKFIHVTDNKSDDFKQLSENLIKNIFDNNTPEFGFEFSVIHNNDIKKSLLNSAYNFGADLLISVPKKQNFLNALFYKSLSKEMILEAKIPLLFIPF